MADTRLGADANFFDLGANSLMMVRVVEKIRGELGLKTSLVRVFQFPTLSSLAAAIAASETNQGQTAVPPEQNRGPTEMYRGLGEQWLKDMVRREKKKGFWEFQRQHLGDIGVELRPRSNSRTR